MDYDSNEIAEVKELYKLMMDDLIPEDAYMGELKNVMMRREELKNNTAGKNTGSSSSRKQKTYNGTDRKRALIGKRPKIETRDRTDNNVNIALRTLGVKWFDIKRIAVKRRCQLLQKLMRDYGITDAQYEPLINFKVDEMGRRQNYPDNVKDVLRNIAEDKNGFFQKAASNKASATNEAKAASVLLSL